MSKVLRRRMVDELAAKTAGAKNFALLDAARLTGNEAVALRRSLREAGLRMSTVKNSVAHHAFEKMGLKALQPHLTGMNAVVYGADAAAIAKKIVEHAERTQKAPVKAAVFEGQPFDAGQIKQLSTLPGREDHLGMILGAFQAVTQKFVSTLNEIPRSFVGTLKALEDKLKEGT